MTYRLILNASAETVIKTSQKANRRFQGHTRTRFAYIAVCGGGIVTSLILTKGHDLDTKTSLLSSVYTILGMFFARIFVDRWLSRRVVSEFAQSPLRERGTPITLSSAGITLEAPTLDWPSIKQIRRESGALTLLMLSHIEPLVIPDADLPPGVSAESFLAQITEWSKVTSA